MSPWLAFGLVALGLAGAIACSFFHLGGASSAIAVGAATLGLAALQAHQHAESRTEVTVLRRSMRPPPTLPDPEEVRRKAPPPAA